MDDTVSLFRLLILSLGVAETGEVTLLVVAVVVVESVCSIRLRLLLLLLLFTLIFS